MIWLDFSRASGGAGGLTLLDPGKRAARTRLVPPLLGGRWTPVIFAWPVRMKAWRAS
jgi:hypothetical protein